VLVGKIMLDIMTQTNDSKPGSIRDTTESMMKRRHEFEETIRQIVQTLLEVTNAQQHTSSILETLAVRQVNTEEALNRLSQKQAITEENLNVLLLTVERHIAGHK
jgi:ferritin